MKAAGNKTCFNIAMSGESHCTRKKCTLSMNPKELVAKIYL